MGGPRSDLRQLEFLTEGRIPIVMSGMLWAFRNTPLYDRLEKLNRLDKTEPPLFGTNIIPARMSGEELRDGYVWLHAVPTIGKEPRTWSQPPVFFK